MIPLTPGMRRDGKKERKNKKRGEKLIDGRDYGTSPVEGKCERKWKK